MSKEQCRAAVNGPRTALFQCAKKGKHEIEGIHFCGTHKRQYTLGRKVWYYEELPDWPERGIVRSIKCALEGQEVRYLVDEGFSNEFPYLVEVNKHVDTETWKKASDSLVDTLKQLARDIVSWRDSKKREYRRNMTDADTDWKKCMARLVALEEAKEKNNG